MSDTIFWASTAKYGLSAKFNAFQKVFIRPNYKPLFTWCGLSDQSDRKIEPTEIFESTLEFFLIVISLKQIEVSSRSTSNLKSILKSSRLTWVLRSDRLENVRAASCKHVKRIEDINTHDYFLKLQENKFLIGSTTQSSPCKHHSPADLIWQSARFFDRIDHSICLHVNSG